MERLTRWNEQTEQAELVEYDREEWKDFKATLRDLDEHFVSTAMNQLAIYEDTGLEPHQIDAICDQLDALVDEVLEYKTAEEQGLLLRLPCRVGDPLYIVGTRCLADQYPEDFDCESMDCDECPYDKEMIVFEREASSYLLYVLAFGNNESHIFGKTVFLSREEAEKALAEMG